MRNGYEWTEWLARACEADGMIEVKAEDLRTGDVVEDGSPSGLTVQMVREGGAGPHMTTIRWTYGGSNTVKADKSYKVRERGPRNQAERIMAKGRTQPLTPVEEAFFGVPDHMAKPRPETGRVPINIDPAVRKRLNTVLAHDSRFRAIGYSEFITRALDALGAE